MASRTEGWKQKIRQHLARRGGDKGGDRDGEVRTPLLNLPGRAWVSLGRTRTSGESQSQAVVPAYLSHAADAVELDPDWINIDTLRTWLRVCDNQHGDRCKLSKAAFVYPRWLLDVDRLCLVEAKSGDRYVALSYVWGQVECAKTLKSNLEQFQQFNSISDANDGVILPRTIRDAIRLTALLGERLLWVDSLCIVQDDVESKHAQLNEMASIYANAYVTIIAANGWDANHGLRGIKGVTESRMISAHGDQDIFESLQPYSTIWYSRGWTFQELIFSSRKIMFQYQMAIWECSCGVWHEATPMSEMSPLTNIPQEPPGFVSCTPFEVKPNFDWPDLQQYMNLVRNYNDRQLTFPEDVIAGFSGVLTTLSSVFVGGFIYGLPEMFFDDVLLWQPRSPLQRRIASSTPSNTALPSWSWVGWRGDIDEKSWASVYIRRSNSYFYRNDFSSFQYKTKPVCQWSCGDGMTWRKLDISHYKYIDDRWQYITSSKQLPRDWSMSILDGDRSYFVHKSMDRAEFYYPVAIGAAHKQNSYGSGHLLSCRTRRLWLRIGPQLGDITNAAYGNHINCSTRRLLTERDDSCGVIQLNIPPTYILKSSDDALFGTACELIAISEGMNTGSYSQIRWGKIFGKKSRAEVVEFYNVLWIEWVNGIAYRKALGRVAKDIWDGHREEWIDVILG